MMKEFGSKTMRGRLVSYGTHLEIKWELLHHPLCFFDLADLIPQV
jgi:hypothetical protein